MDTQTITTCELVLQDISDLPKKKLIKYFKLYKKKKKSKQIQHNYKRLFTSYLRLGCCKLSLKSGLIVETAS